jgi:predicted dehydrogenase
VNEVRFAVIGVGHLGRIHARLLKQQAGAQLVGIVDPVPAAREAVAAELACPAFSDHTELAGRIDAAIIATPSRQHHAVAAELLAQGVHVFVEKPMTLNVGDADDLIRVAAARNLVLQVGHVERFNPAFVAARPHLGEPKYIEAVRAGTFTCRSTDVGVVLDLMIHDIDIVLSLVDDEVTSVDALGAAVFGPNEDWAQARLTFAGGCVANLSASRVAMEPARRMQIVAHDRMASIDFASRRARVMRPSEQVLAGDVDVNALAPAERTQLVANLFTDYLPVTDLPGLDSNAIVEEQREFVAAVREVAEVSVSGRDGRRALDIAERVLVAIATHRWDGAADGAVGPRPGSAVPAMAEPILRGPHWGQIRHAARSRRLAG